jgi:hypothetical protein
MKHETKNNHALYLCRHLNHCLVAGLGVIVHVGRIHPYSPDPGDHFDSGSAISGKTDLADLVTINIQPK